MEQWRIEKAELVKQYHLQNLSAEKNGIVFAGSSLMEMFPIEQWVAEMPEPKPIVYNRGVGGYTTIDLLPILDICVWELQPRKVFINIGTNDLSYPEQTIEAIMGRYDQILMQIEEHLPGVPIYLMAYYPVNPEAAANDQVREWLKVRSNEKISVANEEVKKLAEKHHQRFIDLNGPLTDEQGRLKAEYTIEGVHINHDGYRAIFTDLMRYAMEEPSPFRPMRRFRQQISKEECIRLLTTEKRGVLSMIGENGFPYGIPLDHWYCPEDGKIYFHCAKVGHKLDAIAACDKVSYCVMDEGYRKNGEWALNINSLVVFGRMSIVEDEAKKRYICTNLVRKFTDDEEYLQKELTNAFPRVCCLEMVIEHMTGKLVNES